MIRFSQFFACMAALAVLAGPLVAQDEKQEETKQEETKSETTAPPTGEQESAEKAEGESDSTEATDSGEPDTGEAVETDDSFEGLLAQFATLNKSLDAVKVQFDEADGNEEINAYRNQYTELVKEARAVVEKIREAGMAKLDEGDTSQIVYETLVGILIDEAVRNRNENTFALGNRLIAKGIDAKYFDKASEADRLRPTTREIIRELAYRCRESKSDDLPRIKLTTSKGDIVLELFENEAPQTVGNFVNLVQKGYYDGLTFHRVLEGFMAQAGCPKGDGTGGPGYNIFCECYKPEYRRHFTGSLSMAKGSARNSGGSQFFITFTSTAHLNGKHTVFGRVIEGMDIVNRISRINPDVPLPGVTPDTIIKAEVIRARDHEYVPAKAG